MAHAALEERVGLALNGLETGRVSEKARHRLDPIEHGHPILATQPPHVPGALAQLTDGVFRCEL
jgi:hypothetical protein